MVQVVSFSGGRTSAYLVHLMEQRRAAGEDVRYIFMDTGAEHSETYKFIQRLVTEWCIDLTCIRMGVSDELGKRNHIEIIGVGDLKTDLYAWKGLLVKYGAPSIAAPFCSSRMKQELAHNYCVDQFGRGGFETWIGIRDDEPQRIFGRFAYRILRDNGMPAEVMNAFRLDVLEELKMYGENRAMYCLVEKLPLASVEQRKLVYDRIVSNQAMGINFLADISDSGKSDILDFWSSRSFDLGIDEHLGNCVFCFKKSKHKIALAAKDEPELTAQFMDCINSSEVRATRSDRRMYRDKSTLEQVIALFADRDASEMREKIIGSHESDTESCTESCEAFACNIEDAPALEEEAEEPVQLINAYCSKLTSLRDKPAHQLKEVGDQWRTPDPLFWGINAMFGPLVLDLFTDGENSKCPAFYTAEDNALTHDWSEKLADLHGAAFGNPPYSRAQQHDGQYITGMVHIMAHTMAMRERGGRYVFLIKAATSETWWPEQADHIAFIRGRVGFDVPKWFVPADEKQVPTGAFFAGAVVIFDKTWRGPAMSYVSRAQLESMGEAFIAQIRREAERLLPHIQPQIIPENIPGREVAA